MKDHDRMESNNKALVIGGGLGGIKAALDLSEAGKEVVLIDKAPAIGGLMTQLDRTFPTNNCDLCTISPRLAESGRQLHIELLPLTELVELGGEMGNFKVTLKTKPRDSLICRDAPPAGNASKHFQNVSASRRAWITGLPPACGIPRPRLMPIP